MYINNFIYCTNILRLPKRGEQNTVKPKEDFKSSMLKPYGFQQYILR